MIRYIMEAVSMSGPFKEPSPSLVRSLVRYSSNSIGQLVFPYVEGIAKHFVTTHSPPPPDLYRWQTT